MTTEKQTNISAKQQVTALLQEHGFQLKVWATYRETKGAIYYSITAASNTQQVSLEYTSPASERKGQRNKTAGLLSALQTAIKEAITI